MRDSQHQVKYVETFKDKIIELGDLNIAEAKIGVLASLAVMEQAKQARIANLTSYLATLDWNADGFLIKRIRAEIESELNVPTLPAL